MDGARHGRAIVMRRYGPPDVLRWEEVALPLLEATDVRIRSIASAVNHSDLEIRAGHWPIQKTDPFPYVPGLEVVGDVVETGAAVRDVQPGDRVITMMQGLGGVRARRPGGYAEYVTVAAAAVAPVPQGVDPYEMAALGLGGVTAYEGLRRLGNLQGKRVAVTGASGGVGSAATAIAAAQGASVVAIVSREERAAYVRSRGAHEVLIGSDALAAALRPESLDGVLDTVGGDLFGPCVGALRPGGALSLVGAVAGRDVRFDAWQLALPVTLTGYSSERSLNGPALREATAAIGEWLRRRSLTPPGKRLMPLTQAAAAHALLERRGVEGRVLLVPASA